MSLHSRLLTTGSAATLVLALLALSTPAVRAEPVTHAAAAGLIFATTTAEVEMTGGDVLSKKDAKVLQTVAVAQPYYGAIAISPDDGLMSEATVAAANYHDTDHASQVALSECDAKKKGAKPCAIVALIRPEGWVARPLQLSSDATAALGANSSGVLAISAATGAWGMGADDAAALADCAAKNPAATDCAVAVKD